jgi:polyhydroxyalkanoate synthase
MNGMPSFGSFSNGWPSWNAGSPAETPLRVEQALDPALVRGIASYRRHPWQRGLVDPPVIWTEGPARLLDYGGRQDPAIVFVPSLINRAYILDLMPGQSMMRWLASQALRPLLLDWGWPGAAERQFTLTDYVAGVLERALATAAKDGPVVLAGYCMGGMLAAAAALRRPERVRALVLLATPWDFHADDPAGATRLGAGLPGLEAVLQTTGTLPIDLLQTLFAGVEPGSIARKFRAFGAMDQGSAAAERFVALEDWLNDGVPLAAPVAREAIGGWYGENTPRRGAWRIAGEVVDPRRLRMPCFVAVPGRDRIVPPASALALAGLIDGAVVHRPAGGHIGMAAGPRAAAGLWTPLLDWLRAL